MLVCVWLGAVFCICINSQVMIKTIVAWSLVNITIHNTVFAPLSPSPVSPSKLLFFCLARLRHAMRPCLAAWRCMTDWDLQYRAGQDSADQGRDQEMAGHVMVISKTQTQTHTLAWKKMIDYRLKNLQIICFIFMSLLKCPFFCFHISLLFYNFPSRSNIPFISGFLFFEIL